MMDAPSLRWGDAALHGEEDRGQLVRITCSNGGEAWCRRPGVWPGMPALANTMSSLPNVSTAMRDRLFRGGKCR